jgi:hypothetical protein
MKGDFTRFTHRPEKHYTRVLKQQGRVDLDADWNEQGEISTQLGRREAIDVIGRCGVPESSNGFEIGINAARELEISRGRIYVDGILCSNEAEGEDDPIAISEQPDLPGYTPPSKAGNYLAYIDVWERHITYAEDPEIREVALGGPDTTTRTRTLCQVRLAPIAEVGKLTSVACRELVGTPSTGTLAAQAEVADLSENPCVVPAKAGYRGLENRLYRVEIHDAGRDAAGTQVRTPTFKWSRDNGSVVLPVDDGGVAVNEVTLKSLGRDEVLTVQVNDWVEVGGDETELAGRHGTLAQVQAVDKANLKVTLTVDVSSHAAEDHLKLRRWDHQASVAVLQDGALPIDVEIPQIALEDGVQVRFDLAATYNVGDYWVIPARTREGTVQWPLDASGDPIPQPQLGITHHYCTLALVRHSRQEWVEVKDCRRLFPPLTELGRGCCTVRVGDGSRSFGDFRSIQDAINSLPPEGGQVCVLPGDYPEHVVIENRKNVILQGCECQSRLLAVSGEPVISIRNSQKITVRTLGIRALEGRAIHLDEPSDTFLHQIELADLDIEGRDYSAILGSGTGVTVRRCAIVMFRLTKPLSEDFEIGREAAVVLRGEDLLIEYNRISVSDFVYYHFIVNIYFGASIPHGGLHIAGGSQRVVIRHNWIKGGNFNGITLGSVHHIPKEIESDDDQLMNHYSAGWFYARYSSVAFDDAGKIFNDPDPRVALAQVAVPDGPLDDVRIIDNDIDKMGGHGISVFQFFPPSEGGTMITVNDLCIEGNRIHGCLGLPQGGVPPALRGYAAYGVIALADGRNVTICDNEIRDNGNLHKSPVCGIFILQVEGLRIEGNHILYNGQQTFSRYGIRGGIVIRRASPSPPPFDRFRDSGSAPLARSPAVCIHANVVLTRDGRALEILAEGPVFVEGNRLTTLGIAGPPLDQTNFAEIDEGAAVYIVNLGSSEDLGFLLTYGLEGFQLANALRYAAADGAVKLPSPFPTQGHILFNDNQVNLEVSSYHVAASVIRLHSYDDISMEANQCACRMVDGFVDTNVVITAASLRAVDNRLQATPGRAILSGYTFGFFNATTGNQANHCIVAIGHPKLSMSPDNRVLQDLWTDDACGDFKQFEDESKPPEFPDPGYYS